MNAEKSAATRGARLRGWGQHAPRPGSTPRWPPPPRPPGPREGQCNVRHAQVRHTHLLRAGRAGRRVRHGRDGGRCWRGRLHVGWGLRGLAPGGGAASRSTGTRHAAPLRAASLAGAVCAGEVRTGSHQHVRHARACHQHGRCHQHGQLQVHSLHAYGQSGARHHWRRQMDDGDSNGHIASSLLLARSSLHHINRRQYRYWCEIRKASLKRTRT